MGAKLTARQQAQLAWLESLPPKLEKANRIIEMISTMQADESQVRGLGRMCDELKAQAGSLNLTPIGDGFGYMGMMLRRAGGLQVKVRGLRELLAGVKINRQWAGLADMTPDFAPIMGRTPVDGFYLDAGWGTWGFKATPVAGETMAGTVASGRNHPLITGFDWWRFERFELTGEKGAAAVGH